MEAARILSAASAHIFCDNSAAVMNQLQALAVNEGYRWKKKLLSEQGRGQLEKLALPEK
jgi:hypothetical protein